MNSTRVRAAAAVAGLVATFVLYAVRLDWSPIYLAHDEAIYALNAYSIATSGRDLNGQFLPVSIPVVGSFFATPAQIYTTAAFLKVAPVSEVTIRLPSVLVGLACIWLVWLIALRLFERHMMATIAAVILVVTPAHFVHSRLATDHLYMVACILGWILVMLRWADDRSDRTLLVAMMCLGVSIYTYLGALIAAPAFAAITLAWIGCLGARSIRTYGLALAGFAAPMVPFALWHLAHPTQMAQQMQMYGLNESSTATTADGARELATSASVIERASVYWDYFSPSFLFLSGDTSLINGTRFTGVFLWPMAILLPLGIYAMLVSGKRHRNMLVLLVFLAAPVAATVVAERYRINRALIMLPAAALIAAAGLECLWVSKRAAGRAAALLLALAMTWQFVAFYRDYFDEYRVRSYKWFEYNIRGGMEEIIRRQPTPPVPVFVARSIQWAEYYWPLYVQKLRRTDLPQATYIHATDAAATVPAGGFMLCRIEEETALIASGFERVTAISEPDGTEWLSVLKR